MCTCRKGFENSTKTTGHQEKAACFHSAASIIFGHGPQGVLNFDGGTCTRQLCFILQGQIAAIANRIIQSPSWSGPKVGGLAVFVRLPTQLLLTFLIGRLNTADTEQSTP